MNPPSSTTRFIGTPRNAKALYLGAGLMVFAWVGDAAPWWLAVIALSFVGAVRKAVRDVRRYDQWRAAWDAMGSAPGAATPTPMARERKASSSRAGIAVAALSLVIIPMVGQAPGADEALRNGLTLLWLAMAGYLLYRLAVRFRRAPVRRRAGTVSAGESKTDAAPEVVEWVLPPASSCLSRADAMRRVPDYCARLLMRG